MCAKTHSYNVTHVYKNLVTWPPRTHHHSPPITLHSIGVCPNKGGGFLRRGEDVSIL